MIDRSASRQAGILPHRRDGDGQVPPKEEAIDATLPHPVALQNLVTVFREELQERDSAGINKIKIPFCSDMK